MFFTDSIKSGIVILTGATLLLTGCGSAGTNKVPGVEATAASVTPSHSTAPVEVFETVPAVAGLSAFQGVGILSSRGYEIQSFLEDDVVVPDENALTNEELQRLVITEQEPVVGSEVRPGQVVSVTLGNPLSGPYAAGPQSPWEITCDNGEYGDDSVNGTFSELGEVWKSDSFKDFTTCSVEYVSTAMWKPSKEEARIAKIANVHWEGDEEPENAYATALEHCAVPPAYEEDWGNIPMPWLEAAAELCPKAPFHDELSAWAKGEKFTYGNYVVGKDIPAGLYRSSKKVSDCYWERSTGSGNIIANNFITYAASGAQVTVRKGETFTAKEDCGTWTKQ